MINASSLSLFACSLQEKKRMTQGRLTQNNVYKKGQLEEVVIKLEEGRQS